MPISDCEVRDPRIKRTRQLLQDALRALLKTKGFDQISVQDITSEATVNRATFYDHYTDKFGLLEAMVAGGFHRLLEERKIAYAAGCNEAVRAIILAVCDYLVETRPECQTVDPTGAFTPLMEAAITNAIRRVILDGAPPAAASPEMIAGAASGAIYGAAKAWFESPRRTSVDMAASQIAELIRPMLPASHATASGAAEKK